MKIEHFKIHLEANHCHLHKSKPRENGNSFFFRRDDDHKMGHGAFSKDGDTLSDYSVCTICHTLNIPVPESVQQANKNLTQIKTRLKNGDLG